MCDPVTMAIMAGGASGTAAMAYGSATLFTAVGIGMTVGSTVLQLSSMGAQQKIDEQRYNEQARRYRTEKEQENLEMLKNQNILKRKYRDEFIKTYSGQSGKGITLGSTSYKQQLVSVMEDYKEDISNVTLSGLEKMANTESLARDVLLAKKGSKQRYKTQVFGTVANLGANLSLLGRELSTPATAAEASNKSLYGWDVGAQRKLKGIY
jgi:hypothetical protein